MIVPERVTRLFRVSGYLVRSVYNCLFTLPAQLRPRGMYQRLWGCFLPTSAFTPGASADTSLFNTGQQLAQTTSYSRRLCFVRRPLPQWELVQCLVRA